VCVCVCVCVDKTRALGLQANAETVGLTSRRPNRFFLNIYLLPVHVRQRQYAYALKLRELSEEFQNSEKNSNFMQLCL
jgi:hypothetical protein